MRKNLFFVFCLLLSVSSLFADALKPRIVFEKYLFSEGVDSEKRYLNRLMVKYFDEDIVRYRNSTMMSMNGQGNLSYSNDFLARHPEITVLPFITSMSEEDYSAMIRKNEAMSGKDLIDLFSFHEFRLPRVLDSAEAKKLLDDILKAPEVEIAYYQSIPILFTCTDLNIVTPNFIPDQTYFNPAPLGTDLEYAESTFGIETTDGVTSNRTGVCEISNDGASSGAFHPGHEDFTTAVNATPEIALGTDGYHGTSVAGMVGACDENNIGVRGFTADHEIRYYDIDALATIADVYTRINAQLDAGEYCTNSWGFGSNPMPPGQSCPCNPGQNGAVPPEYDPGIKAAIDNGAAGGIFYFLSAGNGCVDLDDATFGNTFRWSTDTWSFYISAINSSGDHDASCFTDWGEKCTLNGWGDGVVTTGRGTHWNEAGQNGDYNASFGGTSAAGPMVAGCAGVLNNIYRDQNAGANISPTTMRSWLTINATPPGNVTPGNIGVFPNLFGITAPELNPDIRSGWTDYIIPRNTNDATSADALLPTTLNSSPSNTYWNWSAENTGHFGWAEPFNFRLFRDDVFFVNCHYDSVGPEARGYCTNFNSNVRGGRHTIRMSVDFDDDVLESDETNNEWVEQYVWNPQSLTAEVPETYSAPPIRFVTGQTGSYENCDGYTLNSGFSGVWDFMGVMATATDADYDCYIFSEAITSQNGFDDTEDISAYGGSTIDIVGKNGNLAGGSVLASVVNFDGETSSYYVEGETSTYEGTLGRGRNLVGTETIGTTEIMESFEWNVDSLVPYIIEVDVTGGNSNLVISVFSPDDIYFGLSNRNWTRNANGAGADEILCFTPSQTGRHCAVIHKSTTADYNETASFNVYIGKETYDIAHNLNSGWSHEIVVEQVIDFSLPYNLPATLNGNTTTNYIGSGYINLEVNACGTTAPNGHNNRFYVDGLNALTTANWSVSLASNATTQWGNQGPIFVFGGRHTISDSIDINHELNEWSRTNNRNDEQFVWTPFAMADQSAYLTVNPAPNYRDMNSSDPYVYRNVDGWRFTGNTHWSGASICPTNVADDYNCQLYDPTTGSEDGFDNELMNAGVTGAGLIEWIVENGNTNGAIAFDMGVSNNFTYPGTPSVGSYRTWQCNSIQDLVVGANNGPFTLALNQLIHVFDVDLAAGTTQRLHLDNLGAVDLGFAIYAPNTLYGSRNSYLHLVNAAGNGADESLVFTPPVAGRYGVVVFKNDNTDLPSCQYRLAVGGVPAAPLRLVLRVLDVSTDPIQMEAHWDSVVTDIHGYPLNVDSYQLYYVLNTSDNYPTNWVAFSTTNQATLSFNVATTVSYFRMIVVAIDNNGVILASSPLPSGEDIRGRSVSEIGSTNTTNVLKPIGAYE